MKLLIVVVNRRDHRLLHDALVEGGFRFTEIGSTGGFLGEGNATLLVGVADEQVEAVLELCRRHCQAREEVVNVAPPDARMYASPVAEAVTVPVGGATVFILQVERTVEV